MRIFQTILKKTKFFYLGWVKKVKKIQFEQNLKALLKFY